MADEEKPKKKSILPLVVYAVLVLASGGAGFAYSKMMLPPSAPIEESAAPAEADSHSDEGEGHGADDAQVEQETLEAHLDANLHWSDLSTITTNIGDPENVWVRVDLSIAATEKISELALAQIGEDILAYFRTVKLVHANSPSGFRHMMGDIKDIANVRAGGKVFDVYPRAVVFE